MLADEVFISKLLTVDAAAAGAVLAGEIAALRHETADDAMEGAIFVALALALLLAEREEVVSGLGHDVTVELHGEAADLPAADVDVKVNVGVRHLGS